MPTKQEDVLNYLINDVEPIEAGQILAAIKLRPFEGREEIKGMYDALVEGYNTQKPGGVAEMKRGLDMGETGMTDRWEDQLKSYLDETGKGGRRRKTRKSRKSKTKKSRKSTKKTRKA